MRKAPARKKFPLRGVTPRELLFRGKRYYFWLYTFTMGGAKKEARKAISRGYQIRIVRDKLTLGATLYSRPKKGTLEREPDWGKR